MGAGFPSHSDRSQLRVYGHLRDPSGTPKHSIPEVLADVQKAVRFVRYNAKRLNLNPDRLGVMGSSRGVSPRW